MKKVQVLLSTYNGEKYLQEQLDSILNQNYSNISILIRDDGSLDGTLEIIEKYAKQYNQIRYYQGNNIGVRESFFDLVKNSDISADYFAFSDQDDVWLENKIARAIEKLGNKPNNIPLLYCGRTTLVDQSLNNLVNKIKSKKIVPNFKNALVENVCIGCTCIMNRELLLSVKDHIPTYTVMHDWWFYLISSAFGEVYYDEESFILYRQHSKNVLGTKTNYFDEFKNRLRNYKSNRGNISRQAGEFDRLFELDDDKKQLLQFVIQAKYKLKYRLRIFFGKEIYRQRKLDNIIFKVLFLLGKV